MSAFCIFSRDKDGAEVWVFGKCPICGCFVREGKVYTNLIDTIKLEGWVCKRHGDVSDKLDKGFNEAPYSEP